MRMNIEQIAICQRAIDTYGVQSQIAITAEELSELIQALMKTLRYPEPQKAPVEVRQALVEEIADLSIVLTHMNLIFNVTDKEIAPLVARKLSRLKCWLDSSDEQSKTMEVRNW